jgi:hypothetical protein
MVQGYKPEIYIGIFFSKIKTFLGANPDFTVK